MSLQDFWMNVHMASRLPTPDHPVDSLRLDAGVIERSLRASDDWLTPKFVAGYAEADFGFLPDQERQRLTRLVEDFLAVASQVRRKTLPTKEQVEQALPLFRDLVLMLTFDRYRDPEAYRLGKQIESALEGERPPELGELWFETARDHAGDPGLWIWAILPDEAAAEDIFPKTLNTVQETLDPLARRVAPERWPYISVRTMSEQAELAEGLLPPVEALGRRTALRPARHRL
jgi:hypothetical protein